MVRLEREVEHLLAAMQHVETTAAGWQGAESTEVSVGKAVTCQCKLLGCLQEPPGLMDDIERKKTSLLEEDLHFDPTTHPNVQKFAQIVARGSEEVGEGEDEDKDVRVGKVS